jgi:hypothetical protein
VASGVLQADGIHVGEAADRQAHRPWEGRGTTPGRHAQHRDKDTVTLLLSVVKAEVHKRKSSVYSSMQAAQVDWQ